jgi:hypothetical protein
MTDISDAAADLMPTRADAALAQIEALKQNPDWVEKHLGGSHETRAELQKLHEVAFQPAPGSTISGAPTLEAQWNETAHQLSLEGNLSAAVIEEIRAGKPAGAEEYRLAVGRKNARMSDPSWVAKYLNNGADERREMLLLNSIISRGVRLA